MFTYIVQLTAMMVNKWTVLMVLGCVLQLQQGVSARYQSYCTDDAIQQCVGPFNEKYMRDTSEELFPYYDEQQFEELCRSFEAYNDCLKPFKGSCSSTQRAVFEGEEDAFGYACGKGADVYHKNKECFKKDPVQEDAGKCARDFEVMGRKLLRELENAYHKDQGEDIKDRYCQAYDDALDCIEDVLKENCNSEIAKWQRKVDTLMNGPILDQIECDAKDEFPTVAIIAIALAIVITIAIIIGCICMFRVITGKRRDHRNDPYVYEHEMHQQQSPPYGGAMPVAAGPEPPAYVEKSPPYEPPVGGGYMTQSVAPSVAGSEAPSAPPSYHTAAHSVHSYTDLQSEHSYAEPTGYDNPVYNQK